MRLTGLSFRFVFALALVAAVSGCGIKPGKVTAPPNVKQDTFPQVYPDPATDPQKPAPVKLQTTNIPQPESTPPQ